MCHTPWSPLGPIRSSVWAVVVHRVNTCASVVHQLFAVYFVKVTHGVVTSANCAILLLLQGNTPTPIPLTPNIPWYKDNFPYKWIQVHVNYICIPYALSYS